MKEVIGRSLVRQGIGALREAGRPQDEFGFVVHGTMADPRWLDPAVDPDDRKPGWCCLGDPRVVNMSPVGLARFTSLRSWLSQWSYDDARADGVRAAADVTVPVLVIGNTADDACTPSHTRRLYDAFTQSDKHMHEVRGATHYYVGPNQQPKLAEAISVITGWLAERGWAAKTADSLLPMRAAKRRAAAWPAGRAAAGTACPGRRARHRTGR